jgi:hypothetical protein
MAAVIATNKSSPVSRKSLNRRSVIFKEMADVETKNFSDMAFYYLLFDASKAEEVLMIKAKPTFKPNALHPLVDSLDVDKELVVRLLYNE